MEELYEKYSKRIFNYLRSLSGNREVAEELTQETFYKAIKNINKFRGECQISTWLCEIAKNEWKNYVKKESKLKTISENNEMYIEKRLIEKSAENEVEDKDKIINIYKQIHKLDEKTKEVFFLRIQGGLSFKEIGGIFEKSEEWARITFYRGKIKLKEEMKDE